MTKHQFLCQSTEKTPAPVFPAGVFVVPAGQWIPAWNHPQKFTKICPCGAMDSRLRGNDDERGRGGDAGITKRESVCDNVLDVPAGQWIPACAGMTMNEGAGAMRE